MTSVHSVRLIASGHLGHSYFHQVISQAVYASCCPFHALVEFSIPFLPKSEAILRGCVELRVGKLGSNLDTPFLIVETLGSPSYSAFIAYEYSHFQFVNTHESGICFECKSLMFAGPGSSFSAPTLESFLSIRDRHSDY